MTRSKYEIPKREYVEALHAGKTQIQIARQLGVSRRTIYTWRKALFPSSIGSARGPNAKAARQKRARFLTPTSDAEGADCGTMGSYEEPKSPLSGESAFWNFYLDKHPAEHEAMSSSLPESGAATSASSHKWADRYAQDSVSMLDLDSEFSILGPECVSLFSVGLTDGEAGSCSSPNGTSLYNPELSTGGSQGTAALQRPTTSETPSSVALSRSYSQPFMPCIPVAENRPQGHPMPSPVPSPPGWPQLTSMSNTRPSRSQSLSPALSNIPAMALTKTPEEALEACDTLLQFFSHNNLKFEVGEEQFEWVRGWKSVIGIRMRQEELESKFGDSVGNSS